MDQRKKKEKNNQIPTEYWEVCEYYKEIIKKIAARFFRKNPDPEYIDECFERTCKRIKKHQNKSKTHPKYDWPIQKGSVSYYTKQSAIEIYRKNRNRSAFKSKLFVDLNHNPKLSKEIDHYIFVKQIWGIAGPECKKLFDYIHLKGNTVREVGKIYRVSGATISKRHKRCIEIAKRKLKVDD